MCPCLTLFLTSSLSIVVDRTAALDYCKLQIAFSSSPSPLSQHPTSSVRLVSWTSVAFQTIYNEVLKDESGEVRAKLDFEKGKRSIRSGIRKAYPTCPPSFDKLIENLNKEIYPDKFQALVRQIVTIPIRGEYRSPLLSCLHVSCEGWLCFNGADKLESRLFVVL